MYPHTSVLLSEWIHFFKNRQLRVYVDCTLGAGGHAEGILLAHPEIEVFVGIDQDPQAIEIARARLAPWKNKTKIIHGNFSQFEEISTPPIDGMLFDLGVSSMQLDQAERGFSFMRDGPLDMRMNPLQSLTAEEIVNQWPENEIARIMRDYGEEKKWRSVARTIVNSRKDGPIRSTRQLAEILRPLYPSYIKKGVNPLTLIFQALRICVNRELEVVETALPKAISKLAPKGILGVISFHSLEDRIAKNIFRDAASDKVETSGLGTGLFLSKEPQVTILTRKPIISSEEEIRQNPRCRSAKLRVIEKK